jgi:hypothetical protein
MPKLGPGLQRRLIERIGGAYLQGLVLGMGPLGTILRLRLPTAEEDSDLAEFLSLYGLGDLAGETIAVKLVVREGGNGEATRQEAATMCSLQRCPQVLKVYGVVSGEVRGLEGFVIDCILLRNAPEDTLLRLVGMVQ